MERAADRCAAAAPPTGGAALDALRWNRGEAYTIGCDDAGGWHARWHVNGNGTGTSHPHDLRVLLDRLDALHGTQR